MSKYEIKRVLESRNGYYVDFDSIWIANGIAHWDYNKNGKYTMFGWRSGSCDMSFLSV